MKKFALIFLAGAMAFNLNAYELKFKASGTDVSLKSVNKFVNGDNKFSIAPTLHGKAIKGAQVKVKFFMPEMPGMPAMHESAKLTEKDGVYSGSVNLPMNGTWQIKVEIKTKDGHVYKGKSSVDI
ncbi:YtkA domain-containing protein [Helicobacter sp. NHP19-012]|uniref:YtkA domain-containing protein n=1 Tax=Helicobacter gastrofelis TaxID=2849642 RepID=A0ABN6I780_9HELI|nr:FixH family protein [Helicobacter sp. NHP19-012]BCZ19400.1 YtkA domain-containing protein [Helicobacter sp. NHP19-012]